MFKSYMNIALQEAESAADLGEIPVGAVIVSAKGEVMKGFKPHARFKRSFSACRNVGYSRSLCPPWARTTGGL